MVPCGTELMKPVRREMQIATDRVGNRLRLVMIVKASQIAPAGVAAQFNQSRADHDPKTEPAKKPENEDRRAALWKWPSVEQRAKKDRQKPSLQQLNFPAIAIPDLANVHDRHVHCPQHHEQDCVCVAAKNNQRQTETTQEKIDSAPSEIPNQKRVGTRAIPAAGEPSWV